MSPIDSGGPNRPQIVRRPSWPVRRILTKPLFTTVKERAGALSRRLFSQHTTASELLGIALVVGGAVLLINA